jgi:protein-tyrosine phosphatase
VFSSCDIVETLLRKLARNTIMRILTVCLGNICRSPLAQGILEHIISREGLYWEVDSAGTSGWHQGELPDRRSIAIAQKYGIDLAKQRSRMIQIADFEYFDHILVMDKDNLREVKRLSLHPEHHQKVSLILSHIDDPVTMEVPDPYYDDSFQRAYDLLVNASEAFVRKVIQKS